MGIICLSDAEAQIKDGCLKPGLVLTTNGTELPCQKIFSRQELLECKYIADLNLLVTATARKDRLTGQLISRVKITGVDLNTGKVKYFKKTHWENFSITRQVILFNEGNNVQAISIEDGKLLWKKKNNSAMYLNDSLNFWIDTHGRFFNIDDGNQKWTTGINDFHLPESIITLSSDTLLLSSSGLHWLHREKGVFRSFHVNTEKKYLKGRTINTFVAISSVLAGVISGVPSTFYSNEPRNLIGISSNLLIYDPSLYYAGRDSLYKLTRDGKKIWTVPLTANETGLQKIFTVGDKLAYINTGKTAGTTKVVVTGHADFKLYDSVNGNIALHPTFPHKEDVIHDIYINGGMVILLLNRHIAIIRTDKEKSSVKFTPLQDLQGGNFHFLTQDAEYFSYNPTEDTFYPAEIHRKDSVFITNNRNILYSLNIHDGNFSESNNEYYRKKTMKDSTEVYYNNDQICIRYALTNKSMCFTGHNSIMETPEKYILFGQHNILNIRKSDLHP